MLHKHIIINSLIMQPFQATLQLIGLHWPSKINGISPLQNYQPTHTERVTPLTSHPPTTPAMRLRCILGPYHSFRQDQKIWVLECGESQYTFFYACEDCSKAQNMKFVLLSVKTLMSTFDGQTPHTACMLESERTFSFMR